MFLFEVKRLIWSALEIQFEFFELCFLQPVLGGIRLSTCINRSLSHSPEGTPVFPSP